METIHGNVGGTSSESLTPHFRRKRESLPSVFLICEVFPAGSADRKTTTHMGADDGLQQWNLSLSSMMQKGLLQIVGR